jgi:hypothetical protein
MILSLFRLASCSTLKHIYIYICIYMHTYRFEYCADENSHQIHDREGEREEGRQRFPHFVFFYINKEFGVRSLVLQVDISFSLSLLSPSWTLLNFSSAYQNVLDLLFNLELLKDKRIEFSTFSLFLNEVLSPTSLSLFLYTRYYIQLYLIIMCVPMTGLPPSPFILKLYTPLCID